MMLKVRAAAKNTASRAAANPNATASSPTATAFSAPVACSYSPSLMLRPMRASTPAVSTLQVTAKVSMARLPW